MQSIPPPGTTYLAQQNAATGCNVMPPPRLGEGGLSRVSSAPKACSVNSNLPQCMVRRLTAREKLVDEESLRQCIRRVCGDVSPGHDEIRRIPVLQNASAV